MLIPLEVVAAVVLVLLLRGGEVPVVGLLAVVALLHRGLQLIHVVVQSVDSSLNMLGYSSHQNKEESLENVLFVQTKNIHRIRTYNGIQSVYNHKSKVIKYYSPRLPLSGVPDVLDELGDKLENETAKDSSIDDKTNQVDNNLDGSSSKALPRSRSS